MNKQKENKYLTNYIDDKQLYKAVMFARKMIRQGGIPAYCIHRAARYYNRPTYVVAHYVGQVGFNVRRRKTKKR